MADATDQIEVQNQFLVAARQRNSEAMVRYSSGLMSYENWEDVVTELVNFERSAIRAERDAMVASSVRRPACLYSVSLCAITSGAQAGLCRCGSGRMCDSRMSMMRCLEPAQRCNDK
jgi:hypothetical protein